MGRAKGTGPGECFVRTWCPHDRSKACMDWDGNDFPDTLSYECKRKPEKCPLARSTKPTPEVKV